MPAIPIIANIIKPHPITKDIITSPHLPHIATAKIGVDTEDHVIVV